MKKIITILLISFILLLTVHKEAAAATYNFTAAYSNTQGPIWYYYYKYAYGNFDPSPAIFGNTGTMQPQSWYGQPSNNYWYDCTGCWGMIAPSKITGGDSNMAVIYWKAPAAGKATMTLTQTKTDGLGPISSWNNGYKIGMGAVTFGRWFSNNQRPSNEISVAANDNSTKTITFTQDVVPGDALIYYNDSNGLTYYDAATLSLTVTLDTVPAPPTNFSGSAVSSTQINLSWNAVTDASSYKLERCAFAVAATCNNFGQIATPTNNSYSDTNLSCATSYRYRLTGQNSAGSSNPTSPITVTTPGCPTPPSAPTNLRVTETTQNMVGLAWNSATGATGYGVERCTGSGCSAFFQIATTGSSSTAYYHTNLSCATSYRYRVKATNSAGSSSYSNVASATTSPCPAPPPPPPPPPPAAPASSGAGVTKEPIIYGDVTTQGGSTDKIQLTGSNDHIYQIQKSSPTSNDGNLTLSAAIPGNRIGVIFVAGNLIINPSSGTVGTTQDGLVFVVKGDVFISPSTTRIDAVIISSGRIYTAASSGSTCSSSAPVLTTSPLIINGSLVSINQEPAEQTPIKFCRTLANNTQAAEQINAQPKYLVILRNMLSDTLQRWSEIP